MLVTHFEISFEKCHFDKQSTALFDSMFTSNGYLSVLTIRCDVWFSKPVSSVIRTRCGPETTLNTVEDGRGFRIVLCPCCHIDTRTHLAQINLSDEVNFQILVNSVSKMKQLKELLLSVDDNVAHLKPDLLLAFEKDTSLIDISCICPKNIFTEAETKKLQFWSARNKDLLALIENHLLLNVDAWSNVLEKVQMCNDGTTLISVVFWLSRKK